LLDRTNADFRLRIAELNDCGIRIENLKQKSSNLKTLVTLDHLQQMHPVSSIISAVKSNGASSATE